MHNRNVNLHKTETEEKPTTVRTIYHLKPALYLYGLARVSIIFFFVKSIQKFIPSFSVCLRQSSNNNNSIVRSILFCYLKKGKKSNRKSGQQLTDIRLYFEISVCYVY